MFCFAILRIFGGNRKKKRKLENLGKNQAPTPQRGEPTPRRRPTPRRGIPSPLRGRGAKMAPLRLGRRPTPQRSYWSQRAIFGFLFSNTSYPYTDSLRTLIND